MWGGDRESQGESQMLAVLSRGESGEPSVEGGVWARTWPVEREPLFRVEGVGG